MKLIPWSQWLDEHIPHYEAERHRSRFLDNPPAVILIVQPRDRVAADRTPRLRGWEEYVTDVKFMNHGAVPLFLENDAHQEWYWAFWDANEALVAVMKL
jgi:hypothetical protein